MKQAGYVPEWVELETTIRERYDEAVKELTLRWNSSPDIHALFQSLHPDHPQPPADHPRYLSYGDHFRHSPPPISPTCTGRGGRCWWPTSCRR